jgi:uncharacterized membrane protein YgcG
MKTEKLIFLAVVAAVLYSVFSEQKKTGGGAVGKFGPTGTLGPLQPGEVGFDPGGGDTSGAGATGSW